jgi:hypothetical protein
MAKRKAWLIEGPRRDYDFYVLPGDTEEDHDSAFEFASTWLEECWDLTECDDPKTAVSIQLRTATAEDVRILEGQDDD